jgi:uncharacterized protein YydD (DUF2326 family)
MKLSKLYSDLPEIFEPLLFSQGLNVVLAEIRLLENRDKDTHNLGKTTLGRLIDFCFLMQKNKEFFLFKHYDRFENFTFFLEIELQDASFLTVRRSVRAASKISFKKHEAANQDFTDLPDWKWDHLDMPFDKAKEMLDSLLDWRALKPWSYRNGLGYQLRSQDDFRDVFHLGKSRGADKEWKPFLAHILGFDGHLIDLSYEKEEEIKLRKNEAKIIEKELVGNSEDYDKIDGKLLLKRQEAKRRQTLLDDFDFLIPDKEKTDLLVDEIDKKIVSLNEKRYSLKIRGEKLRASLEDDQILFDTENAALLFRQAGVLFQGQIKKDFEQLITFNRAITQERRAYLQEELSEIESDIKSVSADLDVLGKRRKELLKFIKNTDIFDKYKYLSADMVTLRADIVSLERQRDFLARRRELRERISLMTEDLRQRQKQIESDVIDKRGDSSGFFAKIQLFFSEIVEDVIAHKVLLRVKLSEKTKHMEFKAEILDESGNATSAGLGHTYRKLLCVAFDLAVLRAHLDASYPRFVFHDGVFESLDDRKKENLLAVFRQYAALGLQPIITLIDSDMPVHGEQEGPVFEPGEIILTLHDEGDEGRLFKMPPW